MVSKEAILDIINSRSWYRVLLFGITLSVYLTLLYSIIIYKSLFNITPQPIILNHTRVALFCSTLIEVLVVITYFSWLGLNVVTFSTSYNYVEVWVPLLVLFTISIAVYYVLHLSYYIGLTRVTYIFGSGQHYKWAQKCLVNLGWLERFFYYCNIATSTLFSIVRIKSLTLNLGVSNHVFVFLVVVIILLV